MKNKINHSMKLLIVFFGTVIILNSCYKEIADAEYPAQLIYMPAALYGNFLINTVALPIGSVPTPGNTFRYRVDLTTRKFIVPLGVYRSGINNDGAFTVDIAVNTDTITKLKAITGKLPTGTELLGSSVFSTVSSVVMKDGEDLAKFDLEIDLDYLLANYPSKNYAMGISISSSARKTNPLYGTTIVLIGTNMMKPTANLTSTVSATDPRTWTFNSTSLMTVGYSWDFGDGTAAVTIKAPSHTYTAAGTYTVTLKALGITGQENASVATKVITVL